MRYLLDTNVWIKILKGKDLLLIDRFAEIDHSELAVCSIVRAELMHGAEKYSNVSRRRMDVMELLAKVTSLPFDDPCADRYGAIRHGLECRACIIGPYDLQIAAVALVHDLTLVTGNVNEFKRVHGLRVEDWSLPVD
ncbi:MAG: type II toxin-antitoxin system VapC family toxin [Akkermansiaceae bacterium]